MRRAYVPRSLVILLVTGLLVALALAVSACGSSASDETTTSAPAAEAGTLTVSAASSLKAAFTEIGKAFDAANNCTTTFNFDASGTLEKQIEGGAPVDVFASAAMKQVTALTDAKLTDPALVRVFARNEIVLVVPADSKLSIATFEDLANADVEKITYGDPKLAPHGVAAEEILTKLGIIDKVKSKVIYGSNVAQALQYVTCGEVDAGILFATEAKTTGDKVNIVATSDPSWHSQIAYPIALVSGSNAAALGQAFIDFVTGSEGQAVLAKYGFLPAPTE